MSRSPVALARGLTISVHPDIRMPNLKLFKEMILGSVSENIIRNSKRPVIVIKR